MIRSSERIPTHCISLSFYRKKGGAEAPPFFVSVVSGAAELRLRRAACPSASFISNGYEGMMKANTKQTQKTVAIAEEL